MAYQIIWTKSALSDLRDLVDYIAEDHLLTAERFGNSIVSRAAELKDFPRIGRIVPEFRDENLREVIIAPYRLIYEMDETDLRVVILRDWHSARGEPGLE